jgi:hypothetical protein
MKEGDKICKHCGKKKIDHIFALGAWLFICPISTFEEIKTNLKEK